MRPVALTHVAAIVDVPVSAPVDASLQSAFAAAVVAAVAGVVVAGVVSVVVVAAAAVEAGAGRRGRVGTALGSTCQRRPSNPEKTIEPLLNTILVTAAIITHKSILLIIRWIHRVAGL